ncbi:MAG: Gfo/Idh/MocA family oxidoreductase [Candidatus Stahlbacteria bacterium]|nr:MAG: Gfo/Idh/MocA family oxidoreductase [Candidatus Stahlbacteria bacterium]
MADKLNIALVGCGARAQTAHLPYLRKNPHVKISALCDTDEAKLAALKDRYAAEKIATSYNEILNDPSIDAVVITTPPHLHHPMALAALDYGKHVFVEMPIALNEAQTKEMISKSRRKKLVLAVAHDDHFRPDAILMRQFMERKEVGELTYAKTGWLRSAQRWGHPGWQEESLKSGSGAFLTLGIPLIDLALFVLGERQPSAISGMAFKRSPDLETEDTAVAQIRFTDDTILVVEVSWILHEPRDVLYLNAYGTKGAALFNPLEIHKEMFGRLVNVAPAMNKKTLGPTSYQGQINAFVSAVMGKAPFPVPIEDALLLARISDGFYRSVKERKEIPLKTRGS